MTFHERANELDPLTHRVDLATTLLRAGRYDEATRAATQALELDPHDPRVRATLGWTLFKQGRINEGIAELGQAYGQAGIVEKAREVLRQLEDPSRPTPVSPYHLAYVYTGLGDEERAVDNLERAFEEGSGAVSGMKGSFLLAPLREHPRFTALLKRIRLE